MVSPGIIWPLKISPINQTKPKICVGGNVFANSGYDNHADNNYNAAITANGDDFRFSLVTNRPRVIPAVWYQLCGGHDTNISTLTAKMWKLLINCLPTLMEREGMKLLMWELMEGIILWMLMTIYLLPHDFQGDNSVLQPRGLNTGAGWYIMPWITSIAET